MSDKTTLATLSGRPTIAEYAQGAAQDATSALADFIAPTVGVNKFTGKFKCYGKDNRFKIPNTLRGLGGDATVLKFERSDKEYNCQPHALDVPLDNIEIEEADGENLLQEAADDSAFLGALAHEREVLDGMLKAAAREDVNFAAAAFNPVMHINRKIVDIIKVTGGSALMQIGIVFDPLALLAFFDNKKVLDYFPNQDAVAPTIANLQKLFLGNTETRISFMVADAEPQGKEAKLDFMLASKVLVFARAQNPTRRDPSFMKTFRPRNRWMVPGTYAKPDGRGEVVKLDWGCDVQVTNGEAAALLNVTKG